ncbi:MAG: hypothetical protein ACLFU7_04585 [Armatimonadota bacterium]
MRTITIILGAMTALYAAHGSAGAMQFTVTNPSQHERTTVARVSIPVPAAEMTDAPASIAVATGQERVPGQTRVITRHPDGSVRRMMLSFPAQIAGGAQTTYTVDPGEADSTPLPSGDQPERVETEAFVALASEGRVQLLDGDDAVLASITPFGPDLVDETQTRLTVLEDGPHYTWLRYNAEGEQWSREVDIEVDRFGQIRLTHRLQHAHQGDIWTPDFGFELSAAGADGGAERTVHFMGFDSDGTFTEQSDLVAGLTLRDGSALAVANPLALRQARGTLSVEADDAGVAVRSNRNEPVEEMETEGLMIQEGQWRVSQLLLAPVGADEMARRCDSPVRAHADWTLYDAVYHTGPPLQAESPLLMQTADRYIEKMQEMSRDGDDWGTMSTSVRLNHCRYIWEDYFRSGDARLLDIARDWSENYRNFTVYWGHKEECWGGGRRGSAWRDRDTLGPGTFIVRFIDAVPGWLTKGFASFWLAYEETGDPRFREAAEAQAEFGAENITCLKNEMRSVGAVADYAKLYEYTGDEFHLQQAVRLWEEFQQGQMENLLFTQHGKPESPGDELYIGNDAFGYKHPFVKPYMVQYATNSLPYLLKLTPDDRHLRDTILALNDWMATHRQPGGGWGYPHYLTARMGWNNEYSRGMMLAAKIEPKQIYLDAIRENLAPVVQLYDRYGELPRGINPWEYAAGINSHERQERYELASDRDVMRDYEEGAVYFGQSPDNCVYFSVLLRDYLEHAPEHSLLESWEILDRIKQLPTTIDPQVAGPVRVALAPDATFALMMDFKSPTPMEATARITALPDGVTAEPMEVRWTAEEGRSHSPEFRLAGTVEAEERATVRWQVGAWAGEQEVTLIRGDEAAVPGAVGYVEGSADEGAASDVVGAALLALGIDLRRVEGLDAAALRGLDGLIIAGEAHARNLAGLADAPERLIEFVSDGGRVALMQLQDSGHRAEYLPLALSLSDESSAVARITRPDHRIFGEPARVESLTGAVVYDSIVEADPEWEVLAVDEGDRPAILEAQVGEGRLLILQTSVDRYVAGALMPPEGLSAADCGNLLLNVVRYLSDAG